MRDIPRNTFSQFLNRLRAINYWHLALIVTLSEIFTAIMNTLMGVVWWGSISYDLIMIGTVDALVVSVIVGIIVLYLFAVLRETERKYEYLKQKTGSALSMAETALYESEQKFRSIVETSSEWIWEIDTTGRHTYCNPAVEKILGYSPDELVGRDALLYLHEDDRKKAADLLLTMIRENQGWSKLELRWRHRNGSHRYLESTAVPKLNQQGELEGFIGVDRDITEAKQTAEQLHEYRLHLEELVEVRTRDLQKAVVQMEREVGERMKAEMAIRTAYRMMREILEKAPFGIYLVNSTGAIDYVNPAMIRISGSSYEEFAGKNVYELPSYSELGITEKIRGTFEGRPFFVGPVKYTSLTAGKTTIRNFIGVPFSDGGNAKAIVFVEDITERLKTEEALFESEERFRKIFEQNEDALFILQPKTWRIIDINPAAMQLYGYSRYEFLSRGISLILEPSDYERRHDYISRTQSDKVLRIDRMCNRRRDGALITVSVRGKMISLKQSEVLLCSFRDISEKIHLEEQARLIQSKLIQTNKMTSLGTLVSGIAHEINNPNNFILVNGQMVTDAWNDALKMLSEYYREHGDFTLGGIPFSEMRNIMPRLLNAISEGSGRIKSIVENLRDFAKQDAAHLDRKVDINRIIAASAMILSSQIKNHTDRFHFTAGKDLPAVRGSSQQLEQVVINVLMNALQSLQDRNKGVSIASFLDSSSDAVVIQVEDEGVGMQPEVVEHITEPFFSTRLEEGGTGLGLSISQSIIREHRGTLKFESAPGRGTRVSIILPADRVAVERN